MKVYELLKELPHDKFMPLLLGACETARSVAIEALSNTENYQKLLSVLQKRMTGSEVSVIQEWCLIQ